jgi:hypothetical protein
MCQLIGPHLLTDDELAESSQYEELIVKIHVPVGSSPERYREKTLETLREGGVEDLPISERTYAEVAEVLSRYFENWRVSMDRTAVLDIIDPDREKPPPAW